MNAPAESSPISASTSLTCSSGCSVAWNGAECCDESKQSAEGVLELKRAQVRWLLSTSIEDLPTKPTAVGKTTYRSIRVDGSEIEFSEGFVDLHTQVYQRALAGSGFGIDDARPAIELAHRIRTAAIQPRAESTLSFGRS